MKALILGAGGQVGRALIRGAPDHVELISLDRLTCDITVPAAVESVIAGSRPTFVFNAAAFTAVDRAETDIESAQAINGKAPGLIASSARRHGARTIHISTDFVFAGRASRPYRPADPVEPLSIYGRTKLEGERAVAAADPEALVLRTAWVYSAQGANFVLTMLRLMRERGQVSVVSDQIGTPTSADTVARALWDLAIGGATGIYHQTDAGAATWYDFAVAIGEEAFSAGLLPAPPTVIPVNTEDFPTVAMRPAFSLLDKRATWAFLGYSPPHWRERLRTIIKEIATLG